MRSAYLVDPCSPTVVFYDGCGLTTTERLLYVALAVLADPVEKTVQVSLEALRLMCGMNEKTISSSRRRLIEKRAIELVVEGSGTRAAVYRLTAGHLAVTR